MKTKNTMALLSLLSLMCSAALTFGQGNAFTYQGQLKTGGLPATGLYDLKFILWDAETNGSPVGLPRQLDSIAVTNGGLTVLLDFGAAVWNGDLRWLEIGVRSAGAPNGFTLLSPRQPVASTPYAIRAAIASSVAGVANQPLDFDAGGVRALRLEKATTSSFPNLIGGSSANFVEPGCYGATISGGGPSPGNTNGRPQVIANSFATIGGGIGNVVTGYVSTISGGYQNTVEYECEYSFIGGGYENAMIYGADFAVIGGGEINAVESDYGAILGGKENQVMDKADFSSVVGGMRNVLELMARYSVISGGVNNGIGMSSTFSTIGGGSMNRIENGTLSATIPGGEGAVASLRGQFAHANGSFGAAGDAQASVMVLRRTTTSAVPTVLSLDGDNSLQQLHISPGKRWTYDVLVTASNTNGATASFQIRGAIKNVAGATSHVGPAPVAASLGADPDASTWRVSIVAEDAVDALVISVTGDGTTIRWVASVRTVELSF